jgi:hypothetical protein
LHPAPSRRTPCPVGVRRTNARSHSGTPGLGWKGALFKDATRSVIHAAATLGIRWLLGHALSETARAFYLAPGLEPSPLESMTLMSADGSVEVPERVLVDEGAKREKG